jgi:serine phosphatase RsbU (regulator of sigma subunit)
LQHSKEEIEKKNEDITASISYAQRIQQAILPTQAEIGKHIQDYFILFRPRDVVSGDFYFFTPTDKGYIVAVIDCTGHGVPGAFMSMIGNEMLNEIINQRHITSPGQILTDLHIAIRSTLKQAETDNRDGMDLVLVHIDTTTRQLAYAGAKNALYVVQAGELIVLKGNKIAIGGEQREQARIFAEQTLMLQESAMLYLTTDGYIDQFGGKQNKKFGTARFKELIMQTHSLPTAEQEEMFKTRFFNWLQKGNEPQIDDVLVWGIRV